MLMIAPSGFQEAKMMMERENLGNYAQTRGDFLLYLYVFLSIESKICT